MPLDVTILGSGTCVPSLARASACALVACGRERLVLDMGCGAVHRLVAAGQPLAEVTHLLLTHFHPDHTGDLAAFLFANQYPQPLRREPLTLVGGPGVRGFFEALKGAWGRWIDLGERMFQIVEVGGPGRIATGEAFALEAAPMTHNPESLAYRVTALDDGACMVYSGDTDACQSLEDLARGADLFICEAALPEALRAAGHLTPLRAGRIAARAGVGRLVLTHLYPVCEAADPQVECRAAWSGPLDVAHDLMRFHVAPGGRGAAVQRGDG